MALGKPVDRCDVLLCPDAVWKRCLSKLSPVVAWWRVGQCVSALPQLSRALDNPNKIPRSNTSLRTRSVAT